MLYKTYTNDSNLIKCFSRNINDKCNEGIAMKNINNLKKIREIYGTTQEEIAKVAGVTRSTVSQWETDSIKTTNTKLEKLSLFYGIGSEYFYEEEVDDTARGMAIDSYNRENEIVQASKEHRNKADEFAKMLEGTTFIQARGKFIFAMKMLLVTADYGELEDLKVAYQITEKTAQRLKAFMVIREQEEEKSKNDQATLFDSLDTYSE